MPAQKPTVLAGAWFPGCGANVIIPPVKQLLLDRKVDVIVLGHGPAIPILKDANIYFKTIEDFGLPDVSLTSLREVFKVERPDLVLMGTSSQDGQPIDTLEHSLTRASREVSIKSLAIFDQWYLFEPRFTDVRSDHRLGLLPDVIAIPDEIARQEMLDEWFPDHRLVITGNPHFDNLPAKAKAFTRADWTECRRKIGLECLTLFFFAGNGFSSAKEEYGYWDLDVIEIILDAMSKLPDTGLVVRLHPRMPADDKRQIADAISKSGANAKVIEDIDSQTLALASDVTFCEFSTIGIEAVYMRRPVISLQPGLKKTDDLIVSKKEIIPVGYTSESCRELVKLAISPFYQLEILEASADFATDGKATERVVEKIYSLLKL